MFISLCSAALTAVSVAVVMRGTEEALTALAPVLLLGVWTWWGLLARTVSSSLMATTWLLMTFACSGALAGFLREDPTLNRLTHAGTAALCAVMVFGLAGAWMNRPDVMLLPRAARADASTAVVSLLAFTVMCTAGMALEVAEAAATWNAWNPNRWHDTILDMVANAVGAGLAATVCFVAAAVQRRSA
jgi:hypothetical protein